MKFSYSLTAPDGVLFDGSNNRAKMEINLKFGRKDMNVYCHQASHFDEDLCGILALEMAYDYVLRKEKKIPFRFIVKRVFNWIIGGAIARFAAKHEVDPLELEEDFPKPETKNQELQTNNQQS